MVLDKTGTITTGKPVVKRVRALNGFSEEALVRLAAAVERWSEHPVAHAIVTRAQAYRRWKRRPDFAPFQAKAPRRWSAKKRVFVGRGDAGAIAVDVDGVRSGEFDIVDEVKPEARGSDPAGCGRWASKSG